MPQNAATSLGQNLGQLLFGAPRDDRAYLEGQTAGALVRDRMASAARSRAAAMLDQDRLDARGQLTPQAFTAAGWGADVAPVLGAVLRSNSSVDLRDLGRLGSPQQAAAQAEALDAMRGGNTALGNQLLAVLEGKPLETTRVTEGQVFNPHGDAGQPVSLTALGQATVADKRASAGEHAAHSRLYDTQTAAGGFNPRTGRAGAITYPTAPDAATYLGDRRNADAFTAWRSQHPEYRDGNEAWIAFRGARPIGAPTGAPAEGDEPAPIYEAPGAVDLAKLGDALAAPAATPAAPAKVGSSPYPEGTRLRGPGGKLYEVRGGVPVEVQ